MRIIGSLAVVLEKIQVRLAGSREFGEHHWVRSANTGPTFDGSLINRPRAGNVPDAIKATRVPARSPVFSIMPQFGSAGRQETGGSKVPIERLRVSGTPK